MGRRPRRVAAGAPLILVDTSVWIDYFSGRKTPQVSRLDRAIDSEEDIVILPVIVTEILQGFRSDKAFQEAEEVVTKLPLVPMDLQAHVDAARLYRNLRRKGVTIRGAVDGIIAQAAILAGAELLTGDKDFTPIARHSPLKLCGEAPMS